MQDDAALTDSEDIAAGASPDASELAGGAARYRAPAAAIIVQDGAIHPNGKYIGGGAAPDTQQVPRITAGHRAPVAAIIVQDGPTPPNQVPNDEYIGG